MNLVKYVTLLTYTLITFSTLAQDKNSKLKIVNAHIGIGASNFINAEAPHKILSSDEEFYIVPSSDPEMNYETNFFQDLKYNFVAGISFEYYFKPDLSLIASLNYEGKGIAIDYTHEETQLNTNPMWVYTQDYIFNISNHYLTLPIALRRYLNTSNSLYIQGGFYTGFLLNSEVDIHIDEEFISNYTTDTFGDVNPYGENYKSSFKADESDFDKELSATFDVGLTIGTGYTLPLSDKIYFNADLLFCFGLKSIDGINDNQLDEKHLPASTGFVTAMRSANYYGLNSNAKNFSGVLTVGLGFKL